MDGRRKKLGRKEGRETKGDATYNQHYTCTMIPFELYSLRRISEKWLSKLCRREDDKFQLLVITLKIQYYLGGRVRTDELYRMVGCTRGDVDYHPTTPTVLL